MKKKKKNQNPPGPFSEVAAGDITVNDESFSDGSIVVDAAAFINDLLLKMLFFG